MNSLTSTRQIVLAEDNPADVLLVRMALKISGLPCELRVLEDGDKAVSFIEEVDASPSAEPMDLLLLDMHLPRRSGDEILQRLRSSNRCAQVPVVVMTSSDAPRDRAQAQQLGAVHYFRKPSDLAEFMELGAIVRELLAAPDKSRPSQT